MLCMALSLSLSLTACEPMPENLQIVLTTGLSDDQIFRLGGEECTKTEFLVYLMNLRNKYEDTYGEEIWNLDLTDESLEERLKESVLTELEQIKIMKLMADNYAVSLSEDQEQRVRTAAQTYYASLTAAEKEALNVSEGQIREMYREYALANALYESLIADVNPEISDDEARIVTVEQIGVRKATKDADGNLIPLSDEEVIDAGKTIREAKRRLAAGEEFEALIGEYNEVGESILSFGHGEKAEAYERAAFNLGVGEVSDVVETDEGYYLIKCISAFDQEQTEENKVTILAQRKSEAFDREYDVFRAGITEEFNQSAYEELGFLTGDGIETATFFEVYDQTMGE